MKKSSVLTMLGAFLGFTLITLALADHAVKAGTFPQEMGAKSEVHQRLTVEPGKKMKIKGVIVKPEGDSFTLRDQWSSEMTVRLGEKTKFSKKYTKDQLIRGLNVEVQGRGDSSGVLVAEKIKFSDKDLLAARMVESQVVPVEQRLGQTENRLGQTEQNAQRLSGQVQELTEISNMARGGAKAAQETADVAVAGVHKTNERISALDDYEARNHLTINFKVNSARLSPEAKAKLDEIANQAKTESGFIIEVTGFASADGSEAFNRQLSQRRADAVIRYLVEEHDIPLRRILMPHGYGTSHPVADNSTREGRQQNRRVEVTLLVNRGLTTPMSVDTSMTRQ